MTAARSLISPALAQRGQRGFTLVEMMIGVLISFIVILLITQVFSSAEMKKRDIAGGSDAQQTAAIVLNQLSDSLRGAGSGLLHTDKVWGCAIKAQKQSTQLLPLLQTLPVPFDRLPTTLRAAPVLVKGGVLGTDSRESDVVMIMGGNSSSANIAYQGSAALAGSAIPIGFNSNGFAGGDLLLVPPNTPGNDCNILQVDPAFKITYTDGKLDDTPGVVAIGGVYTSVLGNDAGSSILNLGQNPQVKLFGVDPAKQTLQVYDLLQMRGLTAPVTAGENVFLLRTLYGIDDGSNGGRANDNVVDRWISPTTSGWTFSDLQAGSDIANQRIDQIKALRIALVIRTSYPTGDRYQPSLDLFATMASGLKQTVDLTAEEQRYRYQIYETIIPLFNMQNLLR